MTDTDRTDSPTRKPSWRKGYARQHACMVEIYTQLETPP